MYEPSLLKIWIHFALLRLIEPVIVWLHVDKTKTAKTTCGRFRYLLRKDSPFSVSICAIFEG
jgi:hypothetical protein